MVRTRFHRTAIAACMASIVGLLLTASDARGDDLSLWQAMERAVSTSEAGARAGLGADSARAAHLQRRGELLPTVTLSAAVTRNDSAVELNGSSVVNQWDYSANASVSVDLFDGAAIANAIAGRNVADGAQHNVRVQEAALRRAAARAYLTALTARRNHEIATAAFEQRQVFTEDITARLDAGFATRPDVALAEYEQLRAEEQMLSARGQLRDALEALALATTLPSVAATQLVDPQVAPTLPPSEVGTDSIEATAETAALREDIEARRGEVSAERLEWLPTLQLSARYDIGQSSFRDPDGRTWSVSLVGTWVLFHGSRRGRIMAANTALEAAQLDLEESTRLRSAQLQTAIRRADDLSEQAALAVRAAERADEAHALILERYEAGDGTTLEVAEAANRAVSAHTRASIIALEVDLALIDVAWLSGLLDDAPAGPQ